MLEGATYCERDEFERLLSIGLQNLIERPILDLEDNQPDAIVIENEVRFPVLHFKTGSRLFTVTI